MYGQQKGWLGRSARLAFLSALALWPSGSGPYLRAEEQHWSAEWITARGAAERDEAVLHFRKTIEIREAPGRYLVDVSADNQFILYVNGKEAGRGPSRGDLAHWRYETYDIGPLLHQGKNLLAATVWHFGTHAALAQMSDRTGFLVHGAGEAERAADTGASWEVEEETGIRALRPEVSGYYAAEPGLQIDGAKWDWEAAGTDEVPSGRQESNWTKPVTLGRGALREERDAPNNWQLVADALPAMERREMAPARVLRSAGMAAPEGFPREGFRVAAHSKSSVLLDNGELTTGYPVLAVRGGRGAKIDVTYAEALVDEKGRKGNRNQIEGKHIEGLLDRFLPDGGTRTREFTPLAWRTWRYLELSIQTADEPAEIAGLQAWFSAYPFVEKAYFHSDDASLEPLWTIGWRTARLDAHDTYMDTPYWERLQYIGDTRIQALISYTVAGDDRLARQAIEAFDASRVPDGLTESRYPSSLVQMIPTFSLLWVGMVHDFWMYRGDAEFVRRQLGGTRTVLDWFLSRQRADGLLGRISWWPFVDWGADFAHGEPPQDEHGGSAVLTLELVEALRDAADLERAAGDKHFAEGYEKAADQAALGVRRFCWNESYGLLADTPAQRHFSQHANILGVWLGVIPPERQKQVLGKILSASDAGWSARAEIPAMTAATYYFRFYLARAIEQAGMGDDYLKLLEPWREMAALGLSTWAESPEPTRSDSHAWSAHPNYDFLTTVAGIEPASAGFGRVRIAPHLGPLRELRAAMPVPQGMVEVGYARKGDGVEAQVKLPATLSGEFVWQGRTLPLHGGEQKLALPQASTLP